MFFHSLKGIVFAATFVAAVVASVGARGQDAKRAEEPRLEFREVPFVDAYFHDVFWAPRIVTNRLVSVPHNIKQCETETNRIRNFRIAAGLEEGEFDGFYFDDSDVYKILEGIGYTLAQGRDLALQEKAEEWIRYFDAAQEPDGYLMTYFKLVKPEEKWTNLAGNHELYCAGHLAEAAVAYENATRDKRITRVSRKLLDLICKRYGPNEGQIKAIPGHEEIELALIRMHAHTGDRKYLEEAKFFVDLRGVAAGRETGLYGELAQDHKPIREQTEVVGHAVRAMYLFSAATELAGYYQDDELLATMKKAFENLASAKSYVTGGIGSTRKNEGFEENYKLPNREAYCETCASIGLLFWSHRMNLATGDSRYADAMERVAYNALAAGYGLNGDRYFYVNPLESNGRSHRQPFFGCACCPSNMTRALPAMSGYIYATARSEEAKAAGTGEDTVVVNLFGKSRGRVELADKYVDVEQASGYPFDGAISFRVEFRMKSKTAKYTPFYVKVRVPEWAPGARGEDGYRVFKVDPKNGTSAFFAFAIPLNVRRVVANGAVEADRGRVAIQRGPLVYCFEEVDNPGVRVDRIVLAKDPEFKVVKRVIADESANDATKDLASRKIDAISCKDAEGRELIAVPYCVWDNRAPGRMAVWVRQDGLDPNRDEDAPLDKDGAPKLYYDLDESALTDYRHEIDEESFDFSASYLEDMYSTFDGTDQTEDPESSADYGVPRATWWAKRGTEEWFEYEFAAPKKLSQTTVYWFDDEAINGGCRVPESWKLSYLPKDSDEWRDVETQDEYSVDKDRDIVVNFKEIETSKVRLQAKLQPEYSGGVLRWTLQ